MVAAHSPPDDAAIAGAGSSPRSRPQVVDLASSGHPTSQTPPPDVHAWRKAERERLIAARLALPAQARAEHAGHVSLHLDAILPRQPSTIVSVYWPFRGELDLRPWMAAQCAKGVRIALPIVAAKAQPLIFREWHPDAKLERGVWDIPFPPDGALVTPNVVIAPLVGFDPAGYRLGYGGGFFDRTLAALHPRPIAIGVGNSFAALATIHPQTHDIRMDIIITDTLVDFRHQHR